MGAMCRTLSKQRSGLNEKMPRSRCIRKNAFSTPSSREIFYKLCMVDPYVILTLICIFTCIYIYIYTQYVTMYYICHYVFHPCLALFRMTSRYHCMAQSAAGSLAMAISSAMALEAVVHLGEFG